VKYVWICVGLLASALLAAAPQTLKVNVDLVNVLFSVTDQNGRFVPGLTKDDFTIEEDGKKQTIAQFSRENTQPLTIGLLIDTSASVSRVFVDEKETAIQFLESTIQSNDLAFVIGFNHEVTLVEDYTDDLRALRRAVDSLTIGQGTSLYDAIYLACKEVLNQEEGRKALILISDGQDTSSKIRYNEAGVTALRSDAVIYSISNRVGGFFGVPGTGNPRTLTDFSLETGGSVYFVGGRNDLSRVFEQITKELRSQYTLAYTSTNKARDGSYRSIRITTKNSSHRVKSRKGYYAPGG
jgi:Ca-activated chloride channel family protein